MSMLWLLQMALAHIYCQKIQEHRKYFEYCRGTDEVVIVVLESMCLNSINLLHSTILF